MGDNLNKNKKINTDLRIIKKKYGEEMMHLCRKLFSTILEEPGLLPKQMLKLFEPTRFLYEDIVKNNLIDDFKDYVYSSIPPEDKEKIITDKTPKELMSEAGYNLYECKSELHIRTFARYYKLDEMLCTFKEQRIKDYYVFFAVKKNVSKIKREDFSKPQRQDEYGTSVISLQFTKGKTNTLSIKNRYNHKVDNPDSTFSNNLNNIVYGLKESFEKYYNFNFENYNPNLNIPGYIKAEDGKFYKYNYTYNKKYYCPNNIIIDNGKVIKTYQENEKYLIFDYFILDLVNKQITLYDNNINDSFIDGIKDIEKITIIKSKENENKTIGIICKNNKIIIEVDKLNKIIGYENQNITEIKDNFLSNNTSLQYINLPNIEKIGNWFLMRNQNITSINFPKLTEIGDFFITYNKVLNSLKLPSVIKIGDSFLTSNLELEELILPTLDIIGDRALTHNRKIKIIDLRNLKLMGYTFHNSDNPKLMEVNMPYIENYIKKQLVALVEKNKIKETKKLLNIKVLKRKLA